MSFAFQKEENVRLRQENEELRSAPGGSSANIQIVDRVRLKQ